MEEGGGGVFFGKTVAHMSNEVEKAFGDLDLHACQFHLSSILSFQPPSGDARKKDLDQEKRYNAVGCYIFISKYD